MSLDVLVGYFGGFMTGLVLANVLRWLWSRRQAKPLPSEAIASLRVKHIQSRIYH